MALAISSITPSEGVTAGNTFVTIEGTDFDYHPYPPLQEGFIGDPGPPLRVFFGLLEATKVKVQPKPGGLPGETIIECVTPRYTGDPKSIPSMVDVVVENLLNPGTVTESDGFKYKHTSVNPAQSISVLYLTHQCLLRELTRQIPAKDIVDRTHTDFDGSTGDGLNVVQIADIPALLVGGPELVRSDGIYRQGDLEIVTGSGEFKILKAANPRDLVYTLQLVDEHMGRLLNFVDLLSNFVDENGRLAVELVLDDPSQGFAYFDLDWLDDMNVNTQASKDNLISAVGTIAVRGVPFTRIDGIQTENTFEAEDIVLGLDPI